MSTEAMAVVVGVVCGVVAAIPMSLLILSASARRSSALRDRWGNGYPTTRGGQYPPVIVIQGGSPVTNPMQPPYYGSSVQASPRQFHIVGDN
jgi:hypothetical protein